MNVDQVERDGVVQIRKETIKGRYHEIRTERTMMKLDKKDFGFIQIFEVHLDFTVRSNLSGETGIQF